MNKLSVVTVLALMLALMPAKANTVYKCEKDGVITYSQLSCGDDAKTISVKLSQGKSSKIESAASRYKKQREVVGKYVEEQDKNRKIARHKAAVETYKEQMAQEFAQMQQQRYRSAADKDNAIKALSQKYNALIGKEHNAIKALSAKTKKSK